MTIWRFNITKKQWDKLDETGKKAIKEQLLDIYKNAITVDGFENAEKQLLKIRKWEE